MRISDWSSDVCSSDRSQIALSARSPLGQTPPTSPCAISQELIERLFMSCDFWLNSCMIFEHSGQTVSIARLKANPTALFATAFKSATISLALMKEKDTAKISIPPQPARRSEEHTSELQSLMRTSYAVCC